MNEITEKKDYRQETVRKISRDEERKALKRTESGKVFGLDDIPVEVGLSW